ncbi:hypothetical protein GCM10022281_11030 [Sphingomonas rosea]|uniref:EF-hand domain-containing protein n=1 Tax=Sphingomonas rosea TaxID=335605 RepID=A0ABP7U0A7_9SPHN
MKKFLLAAGALFATTAAIAQVPPPPPMKPNPMMARNVVETRAQAVERVRAMFARLDTNRDGFVTAAEVQAMRGMARPPMPPRPEGGPARGPALFDRLDTNRDNMISRDEFDRSQAMRGGGGERREARMGQRGMKMHGMGGGMLKRADANNDQRISLAEMEAAALQRFDRSDVNRDGRITPEERQQMRQQMQVRRPVAPPAPPAPAPAPVR